jgi:protein-S-isoprenylcysteine O-methyltransferase Ste14
MGCLLILLGEFIRIYGVAFIGGVSRTKSYSTGQKVIKTGPFAHVRNPLYIGNLILSSGFVILANVDFGITSQDQRFFLLFFLLFFFLQYIPIVNWEENNLYNIFGEEYKNYLLTVPRWIPNLLPQKTEQGEKREQVAEDYVAALKSERNTLLSILTLTLLLLWRGGYLF